jgi:hypothetical protein
MVLVRIALPDRLSKLLNGIVIDVFKIELRGSSTIALGAYSSAEFLAKISAVGIFSLIIVSY